MVEGCELGKLSRFARFWTRLILGMVRQIFKTRELVLNPLQRFTLEERKTQHDSRNRHSIKENMENLLLEVADPQKYYVMNQLQ
jgi:hypothetical protein